MNTDNSNGPTNFIAFSTLESYTVVALHEIVCCIAEGGYARVHLESKDELLLAKGLAKLEAFLPKEVFVRVHNNTIVNLAHVRKVLKGDGKSLLLTNGMSVTLAERRKKVLMERLLVF